MIRVVVAASYERARAHLHDKAPDQNPYDVRIVTGPSAAAACQGNSYGHDEILWAPGWTEMRGASAVRDYMRMLTRG